MDTVKTPKGTALPLLNLKGKKYLQVAYRLQWFVEENARYAIQTDFLKLDDEQTIAKVTIQLYNEQGVPLKSVSGVKRETKKDFSDHTEKAETGALGRALLALGYGTQYALSDLDEGDRLADSPLPEVPRQAPALKVAPKIAQQTVQVSANSSSFTNAKIVNESEEF